MMHTKNNNLIRRCGFTLVELLVVIAIMGALTALMLPRLRTVNQDRNIREAARVVGSKFAEASQRAIEKGSAGLVLIRNPNMVDADGVEYGATQIYISRAVPPYLGDGVATVGSVATATSIYVPEPLEQDESKIISVGDSVRFGVSDPVSSPVAYRITEITPAGANIQLELETTSTEIPKPDLPGVGISVFYVIERQPRPIKSSAVDLPPGYLIDLRASGPMASMETGNSSGLPLERTIFHERYKPNVQDFGVGNADQLELQKLARRIDIFFNSTGGIHLVKRYYGDWDYGGDGAISVSSIQSSLHFLVTPSSTSLLPTGREEAIQALSGASNLWVTVNNTTGGVNIGYNNPPIDITTGLLSDLLPAARKAAQSGNSAAQ